MSSTTTNLGLYKVNPTTDGENTFNIDTMLNENWDRIDADVAKKTEIPTIPTSLPANGGNSTTVHDHTAAATPQTDEKIDLIGMTNEVKNEIDTHKADNEYQTPTIVGTQIQITKQSSTSRLYFKLVSDLTGGAITISLDGGSTSKPLQDVEGNVISELKKGFVEVIADATFFTLRNRGSGGIKNTINGIFTLGTTETEKIITISSIDPSKSIITADQMLVSGTSYSDDFMVSAEIIDSTTIKFKRAVSGTGLQITYEIVEFENVKSKQSGVSNSVSAGVGTININPVKIEKSLLVYSFYTSTRSTASSYYFIQPYFFDTSTIKVNLATTSKYLYWQVLEFN